MLIKSLIKRKNGTNCDLGPDAKYHFRPLDKDLKPGTPEFLNAPHVCEVANQLHMARLLSIPEGYALYLPDQDASEAAAVLAAANSGEIKPAAEAGKTLLPFVEPDSGEAKETGDDPVERAKIVTEYEAAAGRKPHYKWSVARIKDELQALNAGAAN